LLLPGEIGLGRSGRKRKIGRRHPSGELAREERFPDDRIRGGRQPHRRSLAEELRLSELAESPIGRLALKGLLGEHQMIACEHYAVLVGQYRATIGAPRSTAGAGRGSSCVGDCAPRSDHCACAAAADRYMRAYDALAKAGRAALMTVNRIAVQREEPAPQDLVNLAAGSSALARHFGLAAGQRREYSGNAN